MNGDKGGTVVTMAILVACCLPALVSAATSVDVGEKVDISTISTICGTLWGWLTGTPGKVLAAGMIVNGMAKTGDENTRAKPLYKIGGGLGVAFVPPLVTSTFDAAPAATLSLAPVATLFERMVSGVLGLRLLQDPVFWICLALTGLTLALCRPRRRAGLL